MTDVKKRLGFLSYAVNGAGVGHVVRQVAIQKWLRRLCAVAGVKSEHWFLTTSEADSLVFQEGFAAFKLPSKTIVEDAGLDKLAYIAMAKLWVGNSVALLRPDVLVVDTFAQGSFHELSSVLDLVHKKVLVQRPLKDSYGHRPAYQALVSAYDAVIVPEHEDDVADVREALGASSARLRFVGPVVRADVGGGFDRDTARARLGVTAGARCVLVTGGGGGDATTTALFDAVHAAVGDDDTVHVVYAVGPLHRGAPRHGPRRTHFVGHDLAEHAAAFDVAVSAAGFNTIHELLLFGVPTIVVPQEKIADDQAARAQRYADRGALLTTSMAALSSTVTSLLADDERRAAMSACAREVMPRGHAKEAAAAILALLWPPSLLKMATSIVDDELLVALAAAGEDLGAVTALALQIAGHDDRVGLGRDDVVRAIALCESAQAPAATLARVVDQLRRRFLVVDDAAFVDAVAAMCSASAVDGQHASLLEIIGALGAERQAPVAVVCTAIVEAVDSGVGRGLDVFGVAAALRTARAPTAGAVQQAGSVGIARLRQLGSPR